jgi:ATP-binding cassette subfamily B protein
LQGFDLTIGAGRLVAIVGANGAGKSTLVKLLCRFYDPETGSITMDGVDLRSLSVQELRSRITVLFQQPVHYNATVRDNIRFGDLVHDPPLEAIRNAAANAGAGPVIERLRPDMTTCWDIGLKKGPNSAPVNGSALRWRERFSGRRRSFCSMSRPA